MKKIALIASAVALVSLAACNNEKPAAEAESTKEVSTDLVNNTATAAEGETIAPEELPKFEFEEMVIDYGEISQGEKVKKLFTFTNVGKSSLIISDAKGSCGCTVPVWPKNPIAPGETGEIEVVFDSNGKSGRQDKTVTLVANTNPNTTVLKITGSVLAPETPNAAQ